ncbi:MAG: hypothetical protein WBP55_05325 [Solirubrobacterales bacterium]
MDSSTGRKGSGAYPEVSGRTSESVRRRRDLNLERVIETMHTSAPRRDGEAPALEPAHEKLAELIAYARHMSRACERFSAHQVDPRALAILREISRSARMIGQGANELAETLEERDLVLRTSCRLHDECVLSAKRFLGPAPTPVEELDYVAMVHAEVTGRWGLLPRFDGATPAFGALSRRVLSVLRDQLRQIVAIAADLGAEGR